MPHGHPHSTFSGKHLPAAMLALMGSSENNEGSHLDEDADGSNKTEKSDGKKSNPPSDKAGTPQELGQDSSDYEESDSSSSLSLASPTASPPCNKRAVLLSSLKKMRKQN